WRSGEEVDGDDDGRARPGAANTSGTIRQPIEPSDLGHATLEPAGAFVAGSHQSFRLTYHAGTFGIDDSGALRVCFRFAADMSPPQLHDPAAVGYTTVAASNEAVLEVRFDTKGNVRPWDRTLSIKVVNGYLRAGETITVTFGDQRQGSPGMRLQTFCEDTFEFRVLVDPIATYNFQPLPEQPVIRIVPGPPVRMVAVLPTLRRVGEPFSLWVKGEDRWGNPSDRCEGTFRLRASQTVRNLPDSVTLEHGRFALEVPDLVVDRPGDVVIELLDATGEPVACANALRVVEATPFLHYWGDLHGQSEETIGTGSARDYFAFARDRAFLDATCHQGNDFQMTGAFWTALNRLTAEFDQPGRFVCLPGYEWSGNTGMGGDRNVLFPEEGRTIRRSSHALIEDRSDLGTDCHTAAALFDALADAGEWDTVVMAHCGGRYADIRLAHDGRFETSVEVHSAWGTFEWLLHDALEMGYRLGIVANSDGHKGRPGASYPGASSFGAIGGLTCFLADRLDRASILECLRTRRHYATTGGPGGRMVIDVRARFDRSATRYRRDPAVFADADGEAAGEALMGDIVHLPEGEVEIEVDILASSPIERLELFNGRELVETIRPFDRTAPARRVRVLWEGASYRGRSREVIWDGTATVRGNRFERAEPVNFFNPDKPLELLNGEHLRWRSLTTGNFAGFDVWLADPRAGSLEIETPLIRVALPLDEIGFDDRVSDASGVLPRLIRVFRLPERLETRALRLRRRVVLRDDVDNPLYIRLTQEDGSRAWTSPIYVVRRVQAAGDQATVPGLRASIARA
ncbi:MAG TPA: DUF3604 domain-containing protein, partial [Geminicoccaceae bacterium]